MDFNRMVCMQQIQMTSFLSECANLNVINRTNSKRRVFAIVSWMSLQQFLHIHGWNLCIDNHVDSSVSLFSLLILRNAYANNRTNIIELIHLNVMIDWLEMGRTWFGHHITTISISICLSCTWTPSDVVANRFIYRASMSFIMKHLICCQTMEPAQSNNNNEKKSNVLNCNRAELVAFTFPRC